MDTRKVFRVFNYLVMIFGCIQLLLEVAMIFLSKAALDANGADETISGGVSFFVMLVLLPSIAIAVISILSGHAGNWGDSFRCRKYSAILLGCEALSFLSGLRSRQIDFMSLLMLAFFGIYCYLAYMET